MIKSIKHKGLEKFFLKGDTSGINSGHAKKISNRLVFLNRAKNVQDMDLPGFRLHSLKGDLKDHWAVDVSGNYRITFKFEDGHAYILDYQDYH